MRILPANGNGGEAKSRVLFVDDRKRFFVRMDRNYRYKYERMRKLLESDSFTTVDISSLPSRLDQACMSFCWLEYLPRFRFTPILRNGLFRLGGFIRSLAVA